MIAAVVQAAPRFGSRAAASSSGPGSVRAI